MFQAFKEVVFQVTKGDVLLVFGVFLVLVNLVAATTVYADKQFALNNKRRVPEKVLFIMALLGSALTQYLIMNFVRHKTLHKKFMIGLPLIAAAQIGLFIWWFFLWF